MGIVGSFLAGGIPVWLGYFLVAAFTSTSSSFYISPSAFVGYITTNLVVWFVKIVGYIDADARDRLVEFLDPATAIVRHVIYILCYLVSWCVPLSVAVGLAAARLSVYFLTLVLRFVLLACGYLHVAGR